MVSFYDFNMSMWEIKNNIFLIIYILVKHLYLELDDEASTLLKMIVCTEYSAWNDPKFELIT